MAGMWGYGYFHISGWYNGGMIHIVFIYLSYTLSCTEKALQVGLFDTVLALQHFVNNTDLALQFS